MTKKREIPPNKELNKDTIEVLEDYNPDDVELGQDISINDIEMAEDISPDDFDIHDEEGRWKNLRRKERGLEGLKSDREEEEDTPKI